MIRFARRRLIAAAVAALVLAGAVGVAIAQTGNGENTTSAEQKAALEERCFAPSGCMLINGFADPNAGDSNDAGLVRVGHAIAAWGKPASACPEAAAAWEAAGAPVDGFIGPCPSPAEAPVRGSVEAKRWADVKRGVPFAEDPQGSAESDGSSR
jgi:hypothetical protein